jgi:hypothetical protein
MRIWARFASDTPAIGEEMATEFPNFRVGIQVADDAGKSAEGEARYTPWAKDNPGSSDFAADLDWFDPDAVRVGLDVEGSNSLGPIDFRLGAQAVDGNDVGPAQYTPWASQGGGWTGLVSDTDNFDPDAFRVIVETRPWSGARVLSDARLGLQLYDNGGQEPGNLVVFTPWASQGGGWTSYAVDRDSFDPDGLKLKLETRFG